MDFILLSFIVMNRPLLTILVTILAPVWFARAAALEESFDTTDAFVGMGTNGLETPVNQFVAPAGALVELPGIRPNALALSPDGRLLVTSGLTNALLVIDPRSGAIRQAVKFPASAKKASVNSISHLILGGDRKAKLSYTGLAFSPDGSRIYLSNINGDIKVFGVTADDTVTALYSISLPPANVTGRTNEIPAGIAVSADGSKIYVALNVANQLVEMDVATGDILRTWSVGVSPLAVALVGNKVYVSNWGGRQPDPDSNTGPIGETGRVRVDDRSIASEGSVSVINLSAGIVETNVQPEQLEIMTGRHACALAVSPNHRYVVCANAGDDCLSVIAVRADTLDETICTRQNPGDPFGAQPDALAFDKSGKKLYVCNGSQNAVAVIQFRPHESQMLGLIPVGWFPGPLHMMRGATRSTWRISRASVRDRNPHPHGLVRAWGLTRISIMDRFRWSRCRPTAG